MAALRARRHPALHPVVPTDAQEEDCRLEVPPLERGFMLFQEYYSWRVSDELEQDNSSEAILATEPYPLFP